MARKKATDTETKKNTKKPATKNIRKAAESTDKLPSKRGRRKTTPVDIPNTGKTADAIGAIVGNNPVTTGTTAESKIDQVQRLADEFLDLLHDRLNDSTALVDPDLPKLNAHDIRRLLALVGAASTKKVDQTDMDELAQDLAEHALHIKPEKRQVDATEEMRNRAALADLLSEIYLHYHNGDIQPLSREQVRTMLTLVNEMPEVRNQLPKAVISRIATYTTNQITSITGTLDTSYVPANIIWPSAVGGDQDPSSYELTQKYIFDFIQNLTRSVYRLTDNSDKDMPVMEWEDDDEYSARRRNEDRIAMSFAVLMQSIVHMLLTMGGNAAATKHHAETCSANVVKLLKYLQNEKTTAQIVNDGQFVDMTKTVSAIEEPVTKDYIKDTIRAEIEKARDEAEADAEDYDLPSVGGMHFHNCNIGFVGGMGPTTIQNCQQSGANHQLDTAPVIPAPKPAQEEAPLAVQVGEILKALSGFTPEMTALWNGVQQQIFKNMGHTTQPDKENA